MFRRSAFWSKQPLEIEGGNSAPIDTDGNATISHRLPGDTMWRTPPYQVSLYPGFVQRLIEVNEDTLSAVDQGYGQHIFYDLEGKRPKRYLVQRVICAGL
jgi:hypothetical protein